MSITVNIFLSVSVLSLFSVVHSLRILGIFPVPFDSHQSVFQMLTAELARQGHELVVLTPLPHKQPIENLTEIDVHDVSYRLWEERFAEFMNHHQGITLDPMSLIEMLLPVSIDILDYQLGTPEMQAILNDDNQHFDVILTEACIISSIIVAARFNAPIIQVSSFGGVEENYITMGAAIHPFLFPEINSCKIGELTVLDRISELYRYIRFRMYIYELKYRCNSLINKYFSKSEATMDTLQQNIHMLFTNTHHIWDNNRPVPPSVIYLGALHLKKPKSVPHELQTYLNKSRNGVIYMSLGSKLQFSDLPPQTINKIFDVVETLPYDVLMKWNGKELPNKPANLRLEKWLPQNDILHHPKIKAFVTQGGLQSTDEAIAAKVPLLGFPIFGDQFFNVKKYTQHGIGAYLDINNLDKAMFRQTIIDVAEEKSYRESIERLSLIMSEQRAGGLERAVYWTEYVGTHGALHLRSPLADASIIEYFMLDIVAIVVATIIFSLNLFIVALKFIVKFAISSFYFRRKLKHN